MKFMTGLKQQKILLAAVSVFVFILLTALGINGSSLGWLKNYPGSRDVMELCGERKLAGIYRGIRCDEFLNHGTPNALSQYAARPQFPRYNHYNGLSERDLSVLHDTGVPIRHFVTLARPACWGFFFLDLCRALAWYWLFPLFAGMLGIFFLLNTVFPQNPKLNYLFSLLLVISPEFAAWSFWPAGQLAGLCFAAGAGLQLLRTDDARKRWLWAAVVFYGMIWAVMTLYVPRIYTAAWLLGMLTLAVMMQENLFRKLKETSVWLPLLTAAAGAGAFILCWESGAAEAVHALLATTYPGQRRCSGGTMGLWTLVKGWLAPLTVYKTGYSNQCELQGPLTLALPLAGWIFFRLKTLKRDWLLWSLVLFTVWSIWYQLIGFPDWLAALTLWDRCNPPRCGQALEFAMTLGILWYWLRCPEMPNQRRAVWIAAGSAAVLGLLLLDIPLEFRQGLTGIYPAWYLAAWGIIIVLLYALLSWTLLRKSVWFLLLFALVHLPGAVFNPVCIAPERIENKLAALVQNTPGQKHHGRFLFMGEKNFNAVAAYLAGNRVLNGYFLDPDPEMVRLLAGLTECPEKDFNRMSNYDFVLTENMPDNAKLILENTGTDHLRLLVPVQFDFRKLPVDFLGVLKSDSAKLNGNSSIRRIKQGGEMDFFQVQHTVAE
ncbi:MAG: hypothetical protein MR727_00940 [Lentisphaeria bacterium]|nr:hypothetical protein [Lentisphaeria bacterium]